MASGIATNNLTVTIVTFACGHPAGAGHGVHRCVNNGVHLGAVAALCVREGMGPKLLDFIAAHGPVELSIIVIAGGAGLMVGHALIDPGELPRGQALALRGREAVKLVLGCAPFLAAHRRGGGLRVPGRPLPHVGEGRAGADAGGALLGLPAARRQGGDGAAAPPTAEPASVRWRSR